MYFMYNLSWADFTQTLQMFHSITCISVIPDYTKSDNECGKYRQKLIYTLK
jgi:hypothetical protein